MGGTASTPGSRQGQRSKLQRGTSHSAEPIPVAPCTPPPTFSKPQQLFSQPRPLPRCPGLRFPVAMPGRLPKPSKQGGGGGQAGWDLAGNVPSLPSGAGPAQPPPFACGCRLQCGDGHLGPTSLQALCLGPHRQAVSTAGGGERVLLLSLRFSSKHLQGVTALARTPVKGELGCNPQRF